MSMIALYCAQLSMNIAILIWMCWAMKQWDRHEDMLAELYLKVEQ